MVIQNQNENGNDEGEGYNIPLKERELYTQINDPPIKDLCDRGIQNYKSPIKGFLNDYMEEKRDIEDSEAKEKAELFKKCVELVKVVFGDLAGLRWQSGDEEDPNGELSSGFNEGIFDAQMFGFMDYTKHDIIPRVQVIKDAYIDLISGDRKFIETVEIATYDTKQTKKRMETWLRKLREVADYPSGDRRFYTFEEKQSIFEKKGGNICQICKNEIVEIDDAHVDHIERFSEGGKTIIQNAQLTHRYCNLAKG